MLYKGGFAAAGMADHADKLSVVNPEGNVIQGDGAGAGVTAAGVFADIMSIANI